MLFRTLHRGLSQPIRYHNNKGRKITYFSLKLLQPFSFFYAVRCSEWSGTEDLVREVWDSRKCLKFTEEIRASFESDFLVPDLTKVDRLFENGKG